MKLSELKNLSIALEKIFHGIKILKDKFPHKEFTIDGRLVGDIGEVIAEKEYEVILYTKIVKDYDAVTNDRKKVQIKATFKDALTFKKVPDYYLGLQINEDGTYLEIYNGPGKYIYEEYSHRKGIGKELLSFPINKMNEISNKIPIDQKIKKRSLDY